MKAIREDITNVLHEAESVFISVCQSKSVVTWYNSQQLKLKENCYRNLRPVVVVVVVVIAVVVVEEALAASSFCMCFSC
jgi:CHASE3 domain sensor protein